MNLDFICWKKCDITLDFMVVYGCEVELFMEVLGCIFYKLNPLLILLLFDVFIRCLYFGKRYFSVYLHIAR